MGKLFTNQKEVDRAIKAAVDQSRKFQRHENTNNTCNRRNHHVSRRQKR